MAASMDWQHERRLVFEISPGWRGWFCERCCWSRPLPESEAQRTEQAKQVESDFKAHDCESFARAQWKK
ncbi:MAG TPA: hypothetical protein VMS96_00370 [Terriglobales bacterium]|nr:hypothetical protein [Terriglobales bacterium]